MLCSYLFKLDILNIVLIISSLHPGLLLFPAVKTAVINLFSDLSQTIFAKIISCLVCDHCSLCSIISLVTIFISLDACIQFKKIKSKFLKSIPLNSLQQ